MITREAQTLLDYLTSNKFEKQCVINRATKLTNQPMSIESVYIYKAYMDGVENSLGEENRRDCMRQMGFAIGNIGFLTNSEVRDFFSNEIEDEV